MNQLRWVALALSAGLLTGCPGVANLNPNTLGTLNSLLGEYGLSLKTVDPTTGQAKTYAETDITSVKDEKGNKIDYKFESGKLVFRPVLEGNHKIFVTLKDGTTQQFTIEGKKTESPDARFSGDVAFIPDSSGQGYTSEVGIGTTIDVEARHDAFLNQMATKRVKVTFNRAPIEGLTPLTIKAVYFDRQKLPMHAYVVESGVLKIDPQVFFLAREYQEAVGKLPMVRVAYLNAGTPTVVLADLSVLPSLPEWQPPQPGEPVVPPPPPEAFTDNQSVDCSVSFVEQPTGTLEQYELDNGLQVNVPKPGEAPPPPDQGEMQEIREKINQYAVTFNVPDLATVSSASVKALFVGKEERPIAPMGPGLPPRIIDLLSISSEGAIKLDPMMIFHLHGYWNYRLAKGSDYPWIRVFYNNGTDKVVRFRFKAANQSNFSWFTGLNWTPMPKPADWPADQPWMPPPPPFDLLGANRVVVDTDLDVGINLTPGTLDTYRTNLKNASGHNPGTL